MLIEKTLKEALADYIKGKHGRYEFVGIPDEMVQRG